jgi:hypothetical protein
MSLLRAPRAAAPRAHPYKDGTQPSNLAQVGGAGDPLAAIHGRLRRRHEQRRQYAQNGDDHQQFQQGEAEAKTHDLGAREKSATGSSSSTIFHILNPTQISALDKFHLRE